MHSTTGDYIPDDAAISYTYNADGTINYATVSHDGKTWRKTYTYSSGRVTAVSGWVLQ